MSQPNEEPKQDAGEAAMQRSATSGSAPRPGKIPVWTDEVDEVLVFSDIQRDQGKIFHQGDSPTK